jgi:hypothetical protein
VNPFDNNDSDFYSGNIAQLGDIASVNNIDEIIFCATNLKTHQIISAMLNLQKINVDYKIASADGLSVIGSNSINRSGELYSIDINSITKPENKRKKRLLDIFMSLFFIFTYFSYCIFIKNRLKMLKNLFCVLFGKKTFVSYNKNLCNNEFLPIIKNGIFAPSDLYNKSTIAEETKMRINMMYAKDYYIIIDIKIILHNWRKMGR